MISVYGIEHDEEWDKIVRLFSNYDVYWLSGYARSFQIHGDGEPLLLFYDDGDTRGINVVMKRDVADDIHFQGKISKDTYFDFSTPYGYGGWLIEGNHKEKLFEEYEKWCVEENIICEFVRFHPVIENRIDSFGYYELVELGSTIAMDLSSPKVIWDNLTSKNRNRIRKAQKNGLRIFNGRNLELYKIFREIYNKTMDADQAIPYYYFKPAFYDSVLENLPYESQVFYAENKDGAIIAASIIIGANGYLNYHLSGSLKEFRSLAPSNLLLYHAALWGCSNGYKTFHLGGGVGSQEDNLYKFKRSFYRGDTKKFCIGKKIFSHDIYNELLMIRKEEIKSDFFPKYRA